VADVRNRDYARRLAFSFAAAIALHEILIGLLPAQTDRQSPESVVAQIITIAKRPKPTPKPRPVPRTTPPPEATPAVQTAVRAPAPKAAATPDKELGGAAAPKHLAVVTPRPVPPESARPVSLAVGTHAGQQNGGTGTGAGAGHGTGGLAGTGSGSGTHGNGNGADADTACGEVDLEPGRVEYRPDGTVVQYVIAKVITAHDVDVGTFPYPFIYPAERQNPFAHLDVKLAADNGVPVQMPPAGLEPSTMPSAVQFVLKYTDPASGHTTLPECASPTP
jgi:hypothetical protein